ncbi:MAG: hypothetical protein JNL67_23080 [Planctomycetaceae bacterium]|nr:hypothetical protein [Planctomycetaceae bacterium]
MTSGKIQENLSGRQCSRVHKWLTAATVLVGLVSSWAPGAAAQDRSGYAVHFRPVDHAVGDVHPFFFDGVCYLFYLRPGGFHSALVTSHDLLQWESAKLTVDVAHPANSKVPYFVLGVIRDAQAPGNRFRSYYGHKNAMYSSESEDLLHWRASDDSFRVPEGEELFRRRRDPFVFWNEDEQKFWCVMTTQLHDRPQDRAGAISYATSSNLQDWTNEGLLLDTGSMGEPECPQMFKIGEYWYLLFSEYHQAVGGPTYLRSRQSRGPWELADADVLDGKDLCAAQVAHDGNSWVLMGWIPDTPARPGNQAWGGHLALPREIFSRDHGRLGSRIHSSIREKIRGSRLKVTRSTPEMVDQASHGIVLPQLAVDIEIVWKPNENQKNWRGRFFQTAKPTGAVHTVDVVIEGDRMRILDNQGTVWGELPTDLLGTVAQEASVATRILIDRDILEVHVSNTYSLVARVPIDLEGAVFSSLTMETEDVGRHAVSEVAVFQLLNSASIPHDAAK